MVEAGVSHTNALLKQRNRLNSEERQNRRQKVFNRGTLPLLRCLDILKFDKNSHQFIMLQHSIWGVEALFGGSWRRDWRAWWLAIKLTNLQSDKNAFAVSHRKHPSQSLKFQWKVCHYAFALVLIIICLAHCFMLQLDRFNISSWC